MKHNHNSGGRPSHNEERATHRSLERGLHVIEAVVATLGGASLAETARRVGLHRSTTHHLLQALVGMGYLNQDARTRRYHPTVLLARLAATASGIEHLGDVAFPFLIELARRGDGDAFLAVYHDDDVTVVARHPPGNGPRTAADGDERMALHATAAGKTILAWRPRAEQVALLDRLKLDRFTDNTIDSRALLEAELRRIRAAGFAVDDEESQDGVRGVATPIFDRTGGVVAALGLAGPKGRMTRQRIKDLRGSLGELARLLSERLGWRPDSQG